MSVYRPTEKHPKLVFFLVGDLNPFKEVLCGTH